MQMFNKLNCFALVLIFIAISKSAVSGSEELYPKPPVSGVKETLNEKLYPMIAKQFEAKWENISSSDDREQVTKTIKNWVNDTFKANLKDIEMRNKLINELQAFADDKKSLIGQIYVWTLNGFVKELKDAMSSPPTTALNKAIYPMIAAAFSKEWEATQTLTDRSAVAVGIYFWSEDMLKANRGYIEMQKELVKELQAFVDDKKDYIQDTMGARLLIDQIKNLKKAIGMS